MPIRFTPNGLLDISTDPADLPEQSEAKMTVSGAMTRCKNLRLDRMGIASTRYGTSKINSSAIDQLPVYLLICQGGNRYLFANTKIYQNESEIESGLTAAAWSAVLYNPYQVTTQAVFALNGTDAKKIEDDTVYNWGIAKPENAATIEEGGSSGLTGDYSARYTYARYVDGILVCESNPSDLPDDAITLSDQSLKITYEQPTDPQVTHIRFYRTIADGNTYLYDQEIAVSDFDTEYDYAYLFSFETSYISGDLYQALIDDSDNDQRVCFTWELDPDTASDDTNIAYFQLWEMADELWIDSTTDDDALGAEAATDHNTPPLGNKVIGPNFGGQLFILKDNLLYFCLPNQGEYWPSSYYVEVSPVQYPLISGGFMGGQLFIASAIEIYTVSGTGSTSYAPYPNSAQCGTLSPNCFEPARGKGIIHLGNDGLYLFTLTGDDKITQAIDPIFHGETIKGLAPINKTYISRCWLRTWNNKLYFGYPSGNSKYPDVVIRVDLGTLRFEHFEYVFNPVSVAEDDTNKRLLAADDAGYVWELEDESETNDGGTAISFDLETKHFNQLHKYFPRYARYDVAVNGATCSGYINLDETAKQTHSLTGDRLTRKRLITGCAGDQLSVRITGTGAVDIYAMEIE